MEVSSFVVEGISGRSCWRRISLESAAFLSVVRKLVRIGKVG